MGTSGKIIILNNGKRGLLTSGKAGVFDASGNCSACCGGSTVYMLTPCVARCSDRPCHVTLTVNSYTPDTACHSLTSGGGVSYCPNPDICYSALKYIDQSITSSPIVVSLVSSSQGSTYFDYDFTYQYWEHKYVTGCGGEFYEEEPSITIGTIWLTYYGNDEWTVFLGDWGWSLRNGATSTTKFSWTADSPITLSLTPNPVITDPPVFTGASVTLVPGSPNTSCPGGDPIYTHTDLSAYIDGVVKLADGVWYEVSLDTEGNESDGAVTVFDSGSSCNNEC